MQTVSTTGVMFTPRGDNFPTVDEVAETNHLNLYGLEVGPIGSWAAVAWSPRILMYADDDAEAMDETNFEVVIGHLGTYATAPTVHQGDWRSQRFDTMGVDEAIAAGWCLIDSRILAVDPSHEFDSTDDMVGDLVRLSAELADYPLLDEDAYSSREWDAWQEYAPMAWGDELRDLASGRSDTHDADPDRADVLQMVDAGDALSILSQHLHYHAGFSGEYGPNFLVIADELERIAEDAAPCPAYAWKLEDARQWAELVAAAEVAYAAA